MLTLIKKYLKEEYYKRQIVIEEISFEEFKKYLILTENEDDIPPCDIGELKSVKKYIKDNYYLNNNKYYLYRSSKFYIHPTYHWCSRLHRTQNPKYSADTSIVDPIKEEGIDLVINSLPLIYNDIVNYQWGSKKEICFKLSTLSMDNSNNLVPYEEAIYITKSKFAPKTYDISLTTHIKGVTLNKYSKKHRHCRFITS